ncbi:hypothetical protein B0H10DRAFT_1953335 [Mycena sp. CBHHK59/15]|nr:hypothetical protein B0H10DRAFT_1953335 [Mycena sp. CBHHK59/15]
MASEFSDWSDIRTVPSPIGVLSGCTSVRLNCGSVVNYIEAQYPRDLTIISKFAQSCLDGVDFPNHLCSHVVNRCSKDYHLLPQNMLFPNYPLFAHPSSDILWWHHRLELALSFAVGKNQADLGRLLDYLSPYAETIWQNLMEEWVYAASHACFFFFDAMLHKLPSEEDRAAYWQHHQVYFEGMALVEYSVPTEAGVEICLESSTSLSQIRQQALSEIQELFEALWESVLHPNAYPTSQQGYPCQINAFRDALEQSISQLSHEWLHKLVPNYMHPLYAVYAHQTRISMEEARRTGDPPRLPST